jgi:uncharacterized iron-regulated membrane protein
MHDSETSRRWPGYGAVWRWHFYAGLFCIPFILWLAITGSFYLFRPQIEALIDRPYSNVATGGPQASATAQVAAAVRAVPGSVLHRYQLPDTDEQAVQIIVGRDMRETRVYVHPQTVAVLKTVDEDSRLMPLVSRLHGELLIGDKGSFIVELAASWAIVMIVSGLFLWWPRGTGLAGIVYPRLGADGRRFWRDVHAVTGLWVSLFALAFLLSGLPWAKSWGSYLKAARSVAAVATIPQDWPVSHSEELKGRAATDGGTRAMLGEHAEHMGMTMEHPVLSYAPIDRLVASVRPLGLAGPVLIAPPTGAGALWTAKSDAADRPLRTNLTLDGATGYILSRQDFRGRPIIDRIVGYGVAAHEGQLFGVANQLLNLALAHGLTTLAVSGAVMWWRRKPEDALGAPPVRSWPPLAIGFIGLLVLLGVLLPMLGVSMIVVLLVERLVLRHLPGPGRWLGLSPAPAVPSPGIDR